MRTMIRTLTLVAVTGAGLLAPAALLAPATAAPVGGSSGLEQIRSYDVVMTLNADASMHVTETIDYDFGSSTGKHGVYRNIPRVFPYGEGGKYERVYDIDDVEVKSPTGAPDAKQVENGNQTVIRIGEEDETVEGRQTYVIDYDVEGVVNGFPDHQELYWNAIGDEWSVSIAGAKATVKGPAAVNRAACFEGSQGSTQTCRQSIAGGTATYTGSELAPAQGMTIVASFPLGTFPDAKPIIREKQTIARAFTPGVPQVGGGLALAALGIGGMTYLVSRRGRDERYLGVTPGLEPGLGQEHTVSRVGFGNRDPIAVQFHPPKDMRPGQLGTLIDEKANVVDVTATIVDLAVRGYLRIEEVQQEGWFKSGDWKLVMVWPAPAEELNDYEMRLLKGIFEGRSEVLLSQLKQTFAADLSTVTNMLYDDVTKRGWFRGNPSSVRTTSLVLSILVLALGIGLTIVLAITTKYALIGVGVALAGLVAVVLAPRMPARTAKGTAALAQARGFREYLVTAEADRIRFEEGEDVFSKYLPYAIVFGVAERWAGVFAQLAAAGRVPFDVPTWYVGSALYAGAFDYNGFGHTMQTFSTETSGSIAAATPSSSGSSGFGGGGFSGGGGGGGGGGSW